MKLTFYGAAKQVTGSMFLLETEDNYKILIDCGQDMEKKRKETKLSLRGKAKLFNKPLFPFEASEINLVILTHAHIDHSGMIPLLFKEGYEGQILCTSPTLYLANILLHDCAQLHQRRLKKEIEKSRNKPGIGINTNEVFLPKEVDKSLDRFVPVAMNKKFKINNNISVTFNQAGHLLGAANVILRIIENGKEKVITFSGDVGRKNYPLLQDPMPIPQSDYIVCESTYGNRNHTLSETPENALYRVIKKTCVEKQGRLIIPAFSVGRSQALLYTLNKLYQNTDLPRIKIYSDSPMALESSKVYEKFINLLNQEAKEFYNENDELFNFDNFEFVQDIKHSRALANHYEPCIIISASGMINGGRVEHHVKENIENSKSTICIIGYCAEGTIGHQLMNGVKEISIGPRKLEVRCDIEVLDCFSAHGGQSDLINFIISNQDKEKLKQIYLVHGDVDSMGVLKNKLEEQGYHDIIMPEYGESVELK
jgi:metallo-beta-lactamase family protein